MSDVIYKSMPQLSDFVDSSKTSRPHLSLQPLWMFVLWAILCALFLVSLLVGSVNIPLEQVVLVLSGGEAERASWTGIVNKIRLPRTITAVFAGAGLGVSGLLMQTFFRNPLAGPFVLGISSGASLGVALVVLSAGTVGGALLAGFGLEGDLLIVTAAAIGSGLTMLIVIGIAHKLRSSITLLILGLMFGYLVAALVSLLLFFAIPEHIQAYINWTFGSFNGVTQDQLLLMIVPVSIGLLLAFMMTKSLNALLLGEGYARSLGMSVVSARLFIIVSTALLAGTVTAFCGPIGFIGVAVPHMCRSLLSTSDHRLLIPSTALMGAIFALGANIVAELPGQSLALPLNPITAFIGAPVVMIVILRQRNIHKSFMS